MIDGVGASVSHASRAGGPSVVILYDEVYMRDEEWVRLLLSILRSLTSEARDGNDGGVPELRARGRRLS
jgi:hypothetical protein